YNYFARYYLGDILTTLIKFGLTNSAQAIDRIQLNRFIYEVSDKLELPMLIHSAGITPLQLMFEKKLVYNSRFADCSKLLKMKVASDYLKKGIVPKIEKWHNKHFLKHSDFTTNAKLYFGIDFFEAHRKNSIKTNWLPYTTEFPLIENFIDNNEVLERHSILLPELYRLGFSHNNCAAKCVKAGAGHYLNFAKKMPNEFKKHMEEEHYLKLYVSSYRYIKAIQSDGRDGWDEDVRQSLYSELDDAYRDYFYGRAEKPKVYVHPCITATPEYSYLNQYIFIINKADRTVRRRASKPHRKVYTEHMNLRHYSFMKKGGKPYPLTQFMRDLGKSPKKIDKFDIAGCGCFVEFENSSFDDGQLSLNI
uniref:hypothetical protein n=1 Tax=Bacillus sp. FJAT-29937 TaxID=1720553 RepID=UPI00083197F1